VKKEELVARLTCRGQRRYGQAFDKALLDDLIKDGLMPRATRVGYEGRRPIFAYDRNAYRRGLHIIRLRSAGIVGRDEIKLQLFRCGYSLPTHDVRDALWNEYRSYAKRLTAGIRSRYVETGKTPKEKHHAALVQSLGELDPDLDAAGLRLSPDTYVEALRGATGAPLDIDAAASEIVTASRLLVWRRLVWSGVASAMLPRIKGLLLVDRPNGRDAGGKIDYVEKLIRSADDAALEGARDAFTCLMIVFLRLNEFASFFGGRQVPAPLEKACVKVACSARHPTWAPSFLVVALMLTKTFRVRPKPDDIIEFLNKSRNRKFKLRAAFGRVHASERRRISTGCPPP